MIFKSLNKLNKLHKNQYLNENDLKEYQNIHFLNIVKHAYENVTYYRNLFHKFDVSPSDIKSLDDIDKIPITTKKDIKNAPPHEIVDKRIDINKCVVKFTSGSTGHPLKIFLSPEERDFMILLNLRILMENGLRVTDKMTYIINPRRFPKSKYFFQYFGILRREYLSVFDCPQKHAEELKKTHPDIIYGYPSNLTLLAWHVKEMGIKNINPKLIFSVAEALEPEAREVLNSVMNVDACDILGTIELGDIAWQCEKRDGYHLSTDAVIVEMLKNGKPASPGEEGKTVCTSLYSYTMPFIRYAVNDIFVPSDKSCSCGRILPKINTIQGRANDFILLPNDQLIASCFLVIIMQEFHNIKQYKVIQEQKNSLCVQIVAGEGYTTSTAQKVKREIEKSVKNELKVEVEEVNEIHREASGKIQTIVSKIIPDLQKNVNK